MRPQFLQADVQGRVFHRIELCRRAIAPARQLRIEFLAVLADLLHQRLEELAVCPRRLGGQFEFAHQVPATGSD